MPDETFGAGALEFGGTQRVASTDDGVRRGVEGMGTRDGAAQKSRQTRRRKKQRKLKRTSGRAPRSRSVASRRTIVDHTHDFSNATRALEARASPRFRLTRELNVQSPPTPFDAA